MRADREAGFGDSPCTGGWKQVFRQAAMMVWECRNLPKQTVRWRANRNGIQKGRLGSCLVRQPCNFCAWSGWHTGQKESSFLPCIYNPTARRDWQKQVWFRQSVRSRLALILCKVLCTYLAGFRAKPAGGCELTRCV